MNNDTRATWRSNWAATWGGRPGGAGYEDIAGPLADGEGSGASEWRGSEGSIGSDIGWAFGLRTLIITLTVC